MSKSNCFLRVGHGFDVHRFKLESDQREKSVEKLEHFIVMGGVKIPFYKSLDAHSDGDVLLHAVCDAMLGAAGLGDIGLHFPNTDMQYSGISSRVLLYRVQKLVSDKGYALVNMDSTIVAEKPKFLVHIEKMRRNIADDLSISIDAVNIKATTTEKLGSIGRGEGIAVHAVVLLSNFINA